MPFSYTKVSSESSQEAPEDMHLGVTRPTKFRHAMERSLMFRWIVGLFLLMATLACELAILYKQPRLDTISVGGEFNHIVPEFRLRKVVFEHDTRYSSDHKTWKSINATKLAYYNLVPRGGGFLNIPDHTTHDLPPPMHFPTMPGKDVFALAIFHQIHCLSALSHQMDRLTMQIRNKDWVVDDIELGHTDHCFNYLRNAITCCGDTTLEGQSKNNPDPGTDGTGAMHLCRNYDEITTWAEKWQRKTLPDVDCESYWPEEKCRLEGFT
ncbi:hypothetical protein ACN47E_002628 [Coniothyrium glycines]